MKKKKILKRILIGLLIFVVVGAVATVWITGKLVFDGSTQLSNNEDSALGQVQSYFDQIGFDYTAFQQDFSINRVEVESTYDGHIIPASYILAGSPDADTVVMIHGLGGNRETVYPVAQIFLAQGLNVLIYDQRSAGENTAQYTTFGYLESYDTADCVAYLDEMIGADKDIYLWGLSFGGGTAGMALRFDSVKDRIAGVMFDCSVSEMDYMLRTEMGTMDIGIPMDFLMFCGNLYTKLALGFTYKDASVPQYVAETELPILVLASHADEVTPFWMAEDIAAASSNAKLVEFSDSPHAALRTRYPEQYAAAVLEFVA